MRFLFLIPFLVSFASAANVKKGTLLIDGKVVADGFQMEPVFHTLEVKPPGTVLDSLCGTPEELNSTKVCLAMPEDRANTYYVVLHKKSEETIFARATLTVLKRIPPINSYLGFGVDRDDQFPRYQIEKQYELRITE